MGYGLKVQRAPYHQGLGGVDACMGERTPWLKRESDLD